MSQDREQAPAPPPGYRPAIPIATKFEVVMRTEGHCEKCWEKLCTWNETQFDHRPPLQMRCWDPVTGDTLPPANDVAFIEAAHKDCHATVTTGRRGTSKLSKRGGDISEVAKTKRLTAEEAEFRKRLLSNASELNDEVGEGMVPPKGTKLKKAWPKREFAKRPKRDKGLSKRAS